MGTQEDGVSRRHQKSPPAVRNLRFRLNIPAKNSQTRKSHQQSPFPSDNVPPSISYPGDDLIPDAAMVYNQTCIIPTRPENVWPWVVQLGKKRGGWYLPRRCEWFLPVSWRGTRSVNPAWQSLRPGDRVDDYSFPFSKDEYFDVVSVDAPRSLVYKSERLGTVLTWALLLSEEGSGTKVHLRFRGRIQSTGFRRKVIVRVGSFMDWATTTPMLVGLAERVMDVEAEKARAA